MTNLEYKVQASLGLLPSIEELREYAEGCHVPKWELYLDNLLRHHYYITEDALFFSNKRMSTSRKIVALIKIIRKQD